jgi:hypothetical protein
MQTRSSWLGLKIRSRKRKFRFRNQLLSLDSTTISLCLELFPDRTGLFIPRISSAPISKGLSLTAEAPDGMGRH